MLQTDSINAKSPINNRVYSSCQLDYTQHKTMVSTPLESTENLSGEFLAQISTQLLNGGRIEFIVHIKQ